MQAKQMTCLDLILDEETAEVEIVTRPNRTQVLYVHINGVTVLRVLTTKPGKIMVDNQ